VLTYGPNKVFDVLIAQSWYGIDFSLRRSTPYLVRRETGVSTMSTRHCSRLSDDTGVATRWRRCCSSLNPLFLAVARPSTDEA
jgi:hypothetical protein